MKLAYALLLALPTSAAAQTQVTSSAIVSGALGVGTLAPRAAMEVAIQAADSYGLKVSSPDGTALLLLDRQAKAGLGIAPTSARLDVGGSGDSGQVGLELQAGNSTASVSSAQIAFGDASGSYRHNIRTRATGEQTERQSLDFYLWTSSDLPTALGSSFVMTLQSSSTANQAGLHVSPTSATASHQLVVSSAGVYAGGVILGYAVGAPCFASLKTDLRRLGDSERELALRDLLSLRPVAFHYKGSPQDRKGLIYEEVPTSIRDGKGAIVVNERLMNLELAFQVAQSRIKALEAELTRLERRSR